MSKPVNVRPLYVAPFALAALLAGCSGASLPGTSAASVSQPASHGQNPTRGSWMTPQAKQSLIYVSSVLTNDVYAYSYSTHQLMGTLTGFKTPYGLCTDKAGDVWIANDGASQIVEYAHGGTSPIATLDDANEYPEGCAVDPITGNLAVTNFSSSTTGTGNVVIYAGAHGSPQAYSDPSIVNYRFCGYDAKGDLFVDGATAKSAFVFAELPKGSSTFKNITISQSIEWPGAVQWDGKDVAIGDTDTVTVYRVDPTSGKVLGSTKLDGANYVDQFWINGSVRTPKRAKRAQIVAPSQDGGTLALYKYPAGGSAKWSISVQEPFGVTVSN